MTVFRRSSNRHLLLGGPFLLEVAPACAKLRPEPNVFEVEYTN